jgi:hypothetical protein
MTIPRSKIPDLVSWYPKDIRFKPTEARSYLLFSIGEPTIIENAFSKDDADILCDMIKDRATYPVNVNGIVSDASAEVGSYRSVGWSPDLSNSIFRLIKPHISEYKICDEYTSIDPGSSNLGKWKLIGASPMLRFMSYMNGGKHSTHYDAGFRYNTGELTLKSFVLYFSCDSNYTGGATRIIDDKQFQIPSSKRIYDDWLVDAEKDQVICKSKPIVGNIFIFDHKMPHDVEMYSSANNIPRSIIRGDLIYRKVV